ncbi:MAG: fluoride efflux transporter CrcB [Flavobacteriales bacterium]|nr:fluoride efflux transporter CrcB [Flavobacteriales bacterium]
MIKTLLIIGSGGFLGSISRYLTQQFLQRYFDTAWPIGTLTVNVVGSFIIGVVFAYSLESDLISNDLKAFIAVGFCGGFTTFSSFALDNFNMLSSGQIISMLLYLTLSLVLGFAALYLGIILVRLQS